MPEAGRSSRDIKNICEIFISDCEPPENSQKWALTKRGFIKMREGADCDHILNPDFV